MAEPLLLAIDLGTSSVKALVATAAGAVAGRGAAEYPILQPAPGYAEQDPAAWWLATMAAVRGAMANCDASAVAAVGLSGQMHGAVLLDAAGDLLTPAVIWPDQRSARQVAAITAAVGAARLYAIAGSPLATGFLAATVRWFQEERPAIWRQVAQVLLPKDYLRWRLTGAYATDPSDGAGSLLLDESRRDWSEELLACAGIDRRLLPPVQPSAAVAGELTAAAAADLGLAPGVPVVTGAADTACGLLGAGAIDRSRLLLSISTGGQVVLPTAQMAADPHGRIHTFASALAGERAGAAAWYHMGATLSAGMALRWLRDNVLGWSAQADAYDAMTALAAQSEPGAQGLLFLPYLVGERTPHMDPNARGAFWGLTLRHGQADLVRAVLEGVTCACYDAFLVLESLGGAPAEVILAGGGARSLLWQQIVADVFGRPVRPLQTSEQSALGALLLAGAGIGLFDLAAAARDRASYGAVVAPDPAQHEFYSEQFSAFRDLYRRNVGHFGQEYRRTQVAFVT